MKVFVIAVVLFIAGALAQEPPIMGNPQISKECTDKEKPVQSELDLLFSQKLTTNPAESTKCYLKCIVEKAGYFKGGKYDDDKIKVLYSTASNKDVLWNAYQGCKNLKGTNDCDTVFQIRICIDKAIAK